MEDIGDKICYEIELADCEDWCGVCVAFRATELIIMLWPVLVTFPSH
jgi:hypothetical protein